MNPSGEGKRLIILYIGSEDGFVPDVLLCFESKKNINDYLDEMNGDVSRVDRGHLTTTKTKFCCRHG